MADQTGPNPGGSFSFNPSQQGQAPAPQQGVQVRQYSHTMPSMQTPQVDTSGMREVTKVLSDLSDGIKGLTGNINEVLGEMTRNTKVLNRDFRDVQGTLGDIIDDMDEWEDSMSTMEKLQKDIQKRGIFSDQSQKEVSKFISDMAKGMDKVADRTKDAFDLKDASKNLKEASKAMQELSKQVEAGALSAEEYELAFRKLVKASDVSANKVSQQWSKTRRQAMDEVKRMNKEIFEEIKRADRHGLISGAQRAITVAKAMGLSPGSIRDGGASLQRRGEAVKNKHSEATSQRDRIQNLLSNPSNKRLLNLGNGGKEGALSKLLYGKKLMDGGGSGLRYKAIQEAEQAMRSGKGFGDLSFKTRASLMGEGSFVKGMGRMFAGSKFGGTLLEGVGQLANGAGGIAKMAGGLMGGAGGVIGGIASKAAPVLQIAKILVDVSDKIAERNQTVEDHTSGGGLAYAGGGAASGYRGMRKLMMSTGDEVILGQTWEKNLSLLKTMIDEGIGLSEDALKGNVNLRQEMSRFTDTGNGSVMGAMFRSSMFNSRPLGMKQEEVMKLSIQLMTEYQQSASDTVDFFTNIGKASKAAGISTAKYLGIVQGLVGQFDAMNKSFSLAAITLEKMGKSGAYTAKQLQEMGTFLGKGQGFELAVKAAIDQSMSKSDRSQLVKIRQGEATAASIAFNQAVAGSKTPGLLGGNKLEDMDPAEVAALIRSSPNDEMTRKNLMGLLERYKGAKAGVDMAKNGGVGATIVRDAFGEDLIGSASNVVQLLKFVGKQTGFSTRDLVENNFSNLLKRPEGVMALQKFGLDGKDLRKFSDTTGAAAHAMVKALPSSGPELARVASMINSSKGLRGKEALTEEDVAQLLKENPSVLEAELTKMPDTLLELLDTNQEALRIMDEQLKATQASEAEAKTRAMNAQTLSSAKLQAAAFEYLFNQMIEPLAAIRDTLVEEYGSGDARAEEVRKKAEEVLRDRVGIAEGLDAKIKYFGEKLKGVNPKSELGKRLTSDLSSLKDQRKYIDTVMLGNIKTDSDLAKLMNVEERAKKGSDAKQYKVGKSGYLEVDQESSDSWVGENKALDKKALKGAWSLEWAHQLAAQVHEKEKISWRNGADKSTEYHYDKEGNLVQELPALDQDFRGFDALKTDFKSLIESGRMRIDEFARTITYVTNHNVEVTRTPEAQTATTPPVAPGSRAQPLKVEKK